MMNIPIFKGGRTYINYLEFLCMKDLSLLDLLIIHLFISMDIFILHFVL